MNAPHDANIRNAALDAQISALTDQLESKLLTWRRDFHANPELGNREARTGTRWLTPVWSVC
jgi:hypothetical protein